MSKEKRFEQFGDICIKDNKEQHLYNLYQCNVILNQQDQQISELQHQLKVSEKALELACKEITGSCEYCSYKTMPDCPIEANCLDEKINYFKTEAKEMMKSDVL